MEDKPDKLEEPGLPYSVKRLTFYKSFAEEQDARIIYWRNLTHIERLEQLRIISAAAFAHKPNKTNKRLTFE
jgi:hypothetical protein